MNAFEFGRVIGGALTKQSDVTEAVKRQYGYPTGGSVEPFRGEAASLSYPVPSLAVGRPDINPPTAPAQLFKLEQQGRLPQGVQNFDHPQMKQTITDINAGAGKPSIATTPAAANQPTGRVPYPIRGAGRVGSVPTLSPNILRAGLK